MSRRLSFRLRFVSLRWRFFPDTHPLPVLVALKYAGISNHITINNYLLFEQLDKQNFVKVWYKFRVRNSVGDTSLCFLNTKNSCSVKVIHFATQSAM